MNVFGSKTMTDTQLSSDLYSRSAQAAQTIRDRAGKEARVAIILGSGLGDFANEFRPMAESQVKRDLLLDTVVESEKLAATEADIDGRVAAMAQARGLPVGQMYAQLEKANRLRELERGVTEEKAFAWLLQQSTIEESAN